jgi:urea carboxylase
VSAGIECNLAYLRQILADHVFAEGRQTTRYLNAFHYRPATLDVIEPGVQSSLQDWPGRTGYWNVGVPPSGPMDHLAFRLANRLAGNPEGTGCAGTHRRRPDPALQHRCRHRASRRRHGCGTRWRGTGQLGGTRRPAGSILKLGAIKDTGCRTYLAVQGGFDVPDYLGSKSTFTLGQFGGHAGRTLRVGDVLHLADRHSRAGGNPARDIGAIPAYTHAWQIGVLYGPHGAPDFFTEADIEQFFATDWEVHYNSSRTGVRLIGPKPEWARRDGGEAGLHPSNIHDNAYAIGAVDFTGDMPVILGPDGPSLGGFVCPATIVQAELWKMGQLRPGDTVRFVQAVAGRGGTAGSGAGRGHRWFDFLTGSIKRGRRNRAKAPLLQRGEKTRSPPHPAPHAPRR